MEMRNVLIATGIASGLILLVVAYLFFAQKDPQPLEDQEATEIVDTSRNTPHSPTGDIPPVETAEPEPAADNTSDSEQPADQPESNDQGSGHIAEPPSEKKLPTLDESDPFLRDRLVKEDTHPYLRRILQADHLVRTAVAGTDLIARGENPNRKLFFLQPKDEFIVDHRGGQVFLSAKNYKRYDGMVDALDALDEDTTARFYKTLEPLIMNAYAELGNETPWKESLEKAVNTLLSAPIPPGSPELLGREGVYIYRDPKLEELPSIQRALIRMGPMHASRVKKKVERLWRKIK